MTNRSITKGLDSSAGHFNIWEYSSGARVSLLHHDESDAPVSAALTPRVSKSQQIKLGSARHCAFMKYQVFHLLSLSLYFGAAE